MKNYRNVDIMHTFENVAEPVESYILPEAREVEIMGQKATLPVGTWMMAAHITDPSTWAAVKSGDLTGFSVTGIRNSAFKSLSEEDATDEAALKALIRRVHIKDLGEDWVAATVRHSRYSCSWQGQVDRIEM